MTNKINNQPTKSSSKDIKHAQEELEKYKNYLDLLRNQTVLRIENLS